MSGFNPYEWLQDLVAQVPELIQPLIVALAGAIHYIEGKGSAALGVFAGIHPVVGGVVGAAGSIVAVVVMQEPEYAGKQIAIVLWATLLTLAATGLVTAVEAA